MSRDIKIQILVPASDHTYRCMDVETAKVVFNKETREWLEYHGDEYLDENDVVLNAPVAT